MSEEENITNVAVLKSEVKSSRVISEFLKFYYVQTPRGNYTNCSVNSYINNVMNIRPTLDEFNMISDYINKETSKKDSKIPDSSSSIILFIRDPYGNYHNIIVELRTITRIKVNGIDVNEISMRHDNTKRISGYILNTLVVNRNLSLYLRNNTGTYDSVNLINRSAGNIYVGIMYFDPLPAQLLRLNEQANVDGEVDVTPYIYNVLYDDEFVRVRNERDIYNPSLARPLVEQQLAANVEMNNDNLANIEVEGEGETEVQLPEPLWRVARYPTITFPLYRRLRDIIGYVPMQPQEYPFGQRVPYMEYGARVLPQELAEGPIDVGEGADILYYDGRVPVGVTYAPRQEQGIRATELLPVFPSAGTYPLEVQNNNAYEPIQMEVAGPIVVSDEELRLIMSIVNNIYLGVYKDMGIPLVNEARLIMIRDNIRNRINEQNNNNIIIIGEQITPDNINDLLDADIEILTRSNLTNIYENPNNVIGPNRSDLIYQAAINVLQELGPQQMEPVYTYIADQDVVIQTIRSMYNGTYVQELLTEEQINVVERERLRMLAFNAANAFQQELISGNEYNDIMRNGGYYPPDIPNAFEDPEFLFRPEQLPIVEIAQGLLAVQQNAVNQGNRAYNIFTFKMALISSVCAVLGIYGISWLYDYNPLFPTEIANILYNWISDVTPDDNPQQQINIALNTIKNDIPETNLLLPREVPILYRDNQMSPVPSMNVSISQALEQNTEIGAILLARSALSSVQVQNSGIREPRLPEPGVERLGATQLDHLLGPVTDRALGYVANALVPLPSTQVLEINYQQSNMPSPSMRLRTPQHSISQVLRTPMPGATNLPRAAPWLVNYNKNGPLPSSTPFTPTKSPTPTRTFAPSAELQNKIDQQPETAKSYIGQGIDFLGSILDRGVRYTGTVLMAGLAVATEIGYKGFQIGLGLAAEGGKFALNTIGTLGGLAITAVVAVVGYLVFRKR